MANKANNKATARRDSYKKGEDSSIAGEEAFPMEDLWRKNQELENKIREQTRELEIEAALERVRAMTMAMHHTEELRDVIQVVFDQFVGLNIHVEHAGFILDYKEREDMHIWLADQQKGVPTEITIPYFDSPHWNSYRQAKARQESFFANLLPFEVKNIFYRDLFEWIPGMTEPAQQSILSKPALAISTVLLDNVGLYIEHYSDIPFTAEENAILMRFGKVFQQSYTRFLDLQKAEAQAREVQIEAALERVRAHTMGMQSSKDLSKVASVLFEEMKNLGGDLFAFGIVLCDKYKDRVEQWHNIGNQGMMSPFSVPIDLDYIHRYRYDQWEAGEELFSIEISEDYIARHFELMFELPSVKAAMDEVAAQGIQVKIPAWEIDYGASFRHGYLLVSSLKPFLEDYIFPRFARVFEQTYTRFLDLQKAEEQTREAKIEVALERVRARSMAMHKSDELAETAAVLFQQLNELAVKPERINIGIVREEERIIEWWSTEQGGKQINHLFKGSIDEPTTLSKLFYAWKEGEKTMVIEQSGKTLKDWLTYLTEELGLPFKEELRQDRRFQSTAFFTHGMILMSTPELLSEETMSLLPRFAKVFEQTYTRFLDLQKAEAQAREARIELSLERIRAQVTAMQESSDLLDIVVTMRTEFVNLGHEAHYFWHMRWLPEYYEKAMTSGDGTRIGMVMTLPRHIHGDIQPVADWEKGKEPTHILAMDTETAIAYVHKMISLGNFEQVDPQAPTLDDIRHIGGLTFIMARTTHGEIGFSLPGTVPNPSQEAVDTLVRFAGVFDLAYKRFEDLKAAESQHHEAQIELALERVRARTMAMHHSEELSEAGNLLFQQLKELGVSAETSWLWFIDTATDLVEIWTTHENKIAKPIRIDPEKLPTVQKEVEAWKNKVPTLKLKIPEFEAVKAIKEFFGIEISQQENAEHFHLLQIRHNYGFLGLGTWKEATEIEIKLYSRFAKVFEQTYTRFLDLQKAEAQAREAQIEAALERVRSRSLAMHKTDELQEVVRVVAEELQNTGVILDTGGAVICTYFQDSRDVIHWTATEDPAHPSVPYLLPYFKDELFDEAWASKNRGDEYFAKEFSYDVKNAFWNYAFEHSDYRQLPDEYKKIILESKSHGLAWAWSENSAIMIPSIQGDLPSEEESKILIRFAKVFEQSFIRFLDLQKAEAQTREAKIEAALEKVRSRTMGMQSSEELPEVANLLFLEVQALGIPAWSCGYNILNDDKKTAAAWMSSEGVLQAPFRLRLYGEASFDEMGDFLQSNETMLVQELGGEALQEHYKHMKSFPDLQPTFENIKEKGLSLPTYQINHLCKFTHGFLLFITYEKVDGSHDIFKRFTKVFDQTYTRFLDLKKAEAQAREAQIENALEKVRSRSLAMQSPDELIEVARLLREEMGALGVEELETSSIYIHDENDGLTKCWFTIKNADDSGKSVTDQMAINLKDTWVGRQMDAFYRSPAKKTSILMQGKNRIEWIRYCEKKSDLFGSSNFYGETIPERTYHLYKFSNGYIGAAAPGGISKESWDLLKRATAVFSFAYTRFRDLQTAEASARAVLRQASLDRVRADISSMRHAGDLDRVTPLIFNELTTLGIPFIRCGVFIVHEKKEMVEVYLSTPEGKSLAVMNLAFDANELAKRSVNAWKKEEVLIQHWSKADFINYGKLMVSQGQVKDFKTYQGNSAAPDSLHLHFIPFNQGLLYVGSTETLAHEQIELIKALAKAFAIAYARYEDFIKLEKAKLEVESAMNELKSTQSQLIHSEKMASLGELTAGIAHEIQNPLNFVNNFSEVNGELLEELKAERSKLKGERDEQLEDEIIADVTENQVKINHHGKRASDIVKGMLQHSRSSNGQKELTDINALADEYLRLAYHGLRAKDKSFNADFKTALDPELPKIMVVPQDIGRVLLNLINNAFYAVDKKAKEGLKDYKPLVTVSTKAIPLPGDLSRPDNYRDDIGRARGGFKEIQIRVTDNGTGIPKQVRDKIFQPFFTTKPTGQGTGLGLSLSYDIIKAHGGELKVDSIKDISTEFIITLPQNQ